jgi:signal transduction histidine kinase
VRSFYQDEDGTLWIGTYDGGLNRFKDGRFTRYTMREGMFDNGVFRILDDSRGNFWMSSNRGVYRVSRRSLEDFAAGKTRSVTTVGYGKADGILNTECNGGAQPAGTRTRDGKLWFPTQKGVAVIDPAAIRASPLPPPVLIEEFSVDNQKVAFGGGAHILPGQERFEIRYTGLSFTRPEQVRFKYRLEGLDKDWVDAGTRRTVDYSYVPPGGYTFRVIAANSDGVWNMEGAALPIFVQPPFWRTWWFISLASLTAIGTAVLWYEQRLWRLRRAQSAQEAFSRRLIDSQEGERKRIAAELHDSLGQSLVIIRNRAMLSLNTPDDHDRAIEQLDEIATAAGDAISEVKEIAYNLRPFQLDRFGLAKAIESMLKTVSEANEVELSAQIDDIDGVFTKEAEINLYRILQESINNMLKHAQATRGSVTVKRDGQRIEVIVQDNGKGFQTDVKHTGEGAKSKFGLVGMSERARILGAKYEIRSSPGEGTTIYLKIDLKEK